MIDGIAHGPDKGATTCQVHMRRFRNGETITIEPFRARGFPIVKDLVVDRSAFDRIIAAGGYVSMNAGGAPDANSLPIPKNIADQAMDSAQCIGCGACVAACKNAAAHLFTSAKITHLGPVAAGRSQNAAVVWCGWSSRWTPKASAAARTKGSAKRCAPRRSRSPTSRGCIASYLKAALR